MAKYPIVSQNPEEQAFYVKLRKKGTDHKFAEMLAVRKAPGFNNTYSPMHPRKTRGRGF